MHAVALGCMAQFGVTVKGIEMRAFVLAGVFAASASWATANSYICNLNSIGEGFLGTQIGLSVDKSGKSGLVYDAVIHQAQGKPMKSRVKKNGKGELEFAWRVTVPAIPDRARISYRAFLDPAKSTVRVRGRIQGATNRVAGVGACKPAKF